MRLFLLALPQLGQHRRLNGLILSCIPARSIARSASWIDLLGRNEVGHPVATTAYFCVPYSQLANAAVSYQAMYQAFDGIRLDTSPQSPRKRDCNLKSVTPGTRRTDGPSEEGTP